MSGVTFRSLECASESKSGTAMSSTRFLDLSANSIVMHIRDAYKRESGVVRVEYILAIQCTWYVLQASSSQIRVKFILIASSKCLPNKVFFSWYD